jgi:hypothetical protein
MMPTTIATAPNQEANVSVRLGCSPPVTIALVVPLAELTPQHLMTQNTRLALDAPSPSQTHVQTLLLWLEFSIPL